jgi:hypothetical protein
VVLGFELGFALAGQAHHHLTHPLSLAKGLLMKVLGSCHHTLPTFSNKATLTTREVGKCSFILVMRFLASESELLVNYVHSHLPLTP